MAMKKIILDTDMGGDCDDVGAAAVLCNLAKQGKAEIVAATYCIGSPWGGYFLQNELAFFGYGNVPVGMLHEETFMNEPVYERYAKPYVEAHHLPQNMAEDAVRVLRRALAGNGGKKDIVLVAIGPLRNIANLLRSPADDISPLTGKELIAANVTEFVTMLGDFVKTDSTEWNVLMDIPSARYAVKEMPVPTVFSGYELGEHIKTGAMLADMSDDHPVKAAYLLHSDGKSQLRESWDLVTVYNAILDDTP
ncbi:MAG: nucleoside hydrolase, partial [Clostridia bacterium]|nr:nucleoside hydrolase [Clostridia bacterium]